MKSQWLFNIYKNGSITCNLPAIRITKQPILLTKSKINRPGYIFSTFFAKNRQSNIVLVLVLELEYKAPNYLLEHGREPKNLTKHSY